MWSWGDVWRVCGGAGRQHAIQSGHAYERWRGWSRQTTGVHNSSNVFDLPGIAQDFQCFIFHDVDLLPEDDRNLYTCPIQPRHMSVSIDSFLYRLPYDDIFGGVSALTVDQFQVA